MFETFLRANDGAVWTRWTIQSVQSMELPKIFLPSFLMHIHYTHTNRLKILEQSNAYGNMFTI